MSDVAAAGSETSARAPGRPRDEQIGEELLKAALNEMAEHGLRNFSISRIAKRTGVARATVYLRWPEKHLLLADTLRATGAPLRSPDTGSLRGDLEIVVDDWSDVHGDPIFINVMANLDAEARHFPELYREYVTQIALPANQTVETVLERAVERGEALASADTHVAARALVGGIWLEARFTRAPLGPEFRQHLTDAIIAYLTGSSSEI